MAVIGQERSLPEGTSSRSTFDMSGGPKGAKLPLERALDELVRTFEWFCSQAFSGRP
jgi:hypothetical protein